MARIEFAPEVVDDFDRFFDHLTTFGSQRPLERIQEIVDALDILGHSPLIGRKVEGGRRELVIGQGSRGYLALYPYVPSIDTVFVLAFRSQREGGYKRDT